MMGSGVRVPSPAPFFSQTSDAKDWRVVALQLHTRPQGRVALELGPVRAWGGACGLREEKLSRPWVDIAARAGLMDLDLGYKPLDSFLNGAFFWLEPS